MSMLCYETLFMVFFCFYQPHTHSLSVKGWFFLIFLCYLQVTTLAALINSAKGVQGLSPYCKISKGARAPKPPTLYAYA